MFRNGADLLQGILTGKVLTEATIDEIVQRRLREDLHLDYKDGALLEDRRERNSVLKQYVAGFANAEGGVLIVGIEDDNDRAGAVSGCNPGNVGGDLYGWATNVLISLAPRVAPVVQVVEHREGQILVVATDRAPHLVGLVEEGTVVHYLRIGDSTCKIDSYLYADLVLGRRQEPSLKPGLTATVELRSGCRKVGLAWKLAVENIGLVWVANIQGGIVGYTHRDDDAGARNAGARNAGVRGIRVRDISEPVNRRIDFGEGITRSDVVMVPFAFKGKELAPLARVMGSITSAEIWMPCVGRLQGRTATMRYVWEGGAYLVPFGGTPLWMQVEKRFTVHLYRQGYPGRGYEVMEEVDKCEVLRDAERVRVAFQWDEV